MRCKKFTMLENDMVLEKLLKFGFLLGGRFVIDEIELQEHFVLFLTPRPSLNGVGNQALLGKQLPAVVSSTRDK